ncbi:MAG: phosphatidylglycerophosphatase A [Alphaproteobacteria bacterium]|nr:phosphatidylglycerophosphatase A [Alphaproteobacteria bacterium]
MSKKLALIIATYFGLGLSPKAPGTVGSFGTLPLAFILAYYTGIYGIIIAAILIFIIGTMATHELIKDQQEKDPGKVVVDEVVGQLLAFTFVADNLYQNLNTWWIYLLGFIAFRFFDICKMGPVKWFDSKMKNAYGVMLDDVCAGLMGSFTLWMGIKFYAETFIR